MDQETKQYKYTFNVVYKRDSDIVEEFVKELVIRFEKEYENTGRKMQGFYPERDMLPGRNILREHFRVLQESRYTIIVIDIGFMNDPWPEFLSEAMLRTLIDDGPKSEGCSRYIVISMNVAKKSIVKKQPYLKLKEMVCFQGDYRKDNPKWDKLVRVLKEQIKVTEVDDPEQDVIVVTQETDPPSRDRPVSLQSRISPQSRHIEMPREMDRRHQSHEMNSLQQSVGMERPQPSQPYQNDDNEEEDNDKLPNTIFQASSTNQRSTSRTFESGVDQTDLQALPETPTHARVLHRPLTDMMVNPAQQIQFNVNQSRANSISSSVDSYDTGIDSMGSSTTGARAMGSGTTGQQTGADAISTGLDEGDGPKSGVQYSGVDLRGLNEAIPDHHVTSMGEVVHGPKSGVTYSGVDLRGLNEEIPDRHVTSMGVDVRLAAVAKAESREVPDAGHLVQNGTSSSATPSSDQLSQQPVVRPKVMAPNVPVQKELTENLTAHASKIATEDTAVCPSKAGTEDTTVLSSKAATKDTAVCPSKAATEDSERHSSRIPVEHTEGQHSREGAGQTAVYLNMAATEHSTELPSKASAENIPTHPNRTTQNLEFAQTRGDSLFDEDNKSVSVKDHCSQIVKPKVIPNRGRVPIEIDERGHFNELTNRHTADEINDPAENINTIGTYWTPPTPTESIHEPFHSFEGYTLKEDDFKLRSPTITGKSQCQGNTTDDLPNLSILNKEDSAPTGEIPVLSIIGEQKVTDVTPQNQGDDPKGQKHTTTDIMNPSGDKVSMIGKTDASEQTERTPRKSNNLQGITNLLAEGQTPVTNLLTEGQTPVTNLLAEGQTPVTNLLAEGQTPVTNLLNVDKEPGVCKSEPAKCGTADNETDKWKSETKTQSLAGGEDTLLKREDDMNHFNTRVDYPSWLNGIPGKVSSAASCAFKAWMDYNNI